MTRYLGGLITKDESLVIPANNFEDTSAPGVWTLEEAQALNKQGLWPTAGVDNPSKFIENVFSTTAYTGTGSDGNQIVNGIDLANEGGMVWIKNRDTTNGGLMDTARGVGKIFNGTYNNNAEQTENSGKGLVSFNNNGFTLNVEWNGSTNAASDYISWTFRKAKNFFDVVTYTGTGSARTVSHSLGSVPGMVIVKNLTVAGNGWYIFHRSLGNTKVAIFTTDLPFTGAEWNNTTPTDAHFTLSGGGAVNASGSNYIGYVFGHDTSSDGMIQCGSYAGNSSNSGTEIDLGFEPQWLMLKRISNVANWYIFDAIRGLTSKSSDSNTGTDNIIYANDADAEVNDGNVVKPTSTGFQLEASSLQTNGSGNNYIYMAIRRGPMQTPTSRSSVFAINNRSSTGSSINITSNFPVDWFFTKERNEAYGFQQLSRLQGSGVRLGFYGNFADQTDPSFEFDHNNKVVAGSDSSIGINRTGESNIDYMFRRAPKFFDVVTYVGTGSAKTENHNLGVAPEMMWIKSRSHTYDWVVYYGDATDYLKLNTDAATADDNTYWNDTAPTSTVFTVGTQVAVNINTGNFVAYLFATLAGISKVGTFSHTNGSSTDVDCGFSSGSSFVIAKRTDSTGDWYVWDSTRGIVSGNDPYVLLNSSAAEVTNQDYIDPLNSGFQIASGFITGSYMFYAIAA